MVVSKSRKAKRGVSKSARASYHRRRGAPWGKRCRGRNYTACRKSKKCKWNKGRKRSFCSKTYRRKRGSKKR